MPVKKPVKTANKITPAGKNKTALKEAMRQAGGERANFEAILEAIGNQVTIQDTGYKIIYQNQASIDSVGAHTGEHCYKAYENSPRVCESCQLEMAFEDGGIHQIEREVNAAGKKRYLEITASPLRDSSGGIIAGIEVARDVTEQRKLKEAFRKTAGTLRSIVAESPLAIIAINLDGIVSLWNPSAERIFGWRENEVTGKRCPLIAGKEEFEAMRAKVSGGGNITGMRVKKRKKDGSEAVLNLAVSALKDETGNISAMVCMLEDITARVEMEERVSQAEQDWEITINQLTDMVTIHDTDFNIVRANKAAGKILGLPVLGKSVAKCYKYFHGSKCPPGDCPSCACLETGEPRVSEIYEPHLNRFLEISAVPRYDGQNKITGLIHIARDVTEKKRLESIAQAANLMDNIGYVFSGIRHEISNPVNTAKLALGVLKKRLPDCGAKKAQEYVDMAINQISRIEFLLGAFKNFNMFEDVEANSIHLPAYIEKTIALMEKDFKDRNIKITADIAPGADCAIGDERALEQVLLNLFTNAADALEGVKAPRITLHAFRLKENILLMMEDNGRGISRRQIGKIFTPFQTTKQKGTGLGLVIVKKMMAKMKGDVEILSEEGRGTLVNLVLPAGAG